MAESRFPLSNKIVFDQLKLNARNKKTTKSTQTWLNVWGKWANKRKFNTKLEEYEHKDLDKKLQMFDTDVRTKNGFFCNFVENIIKKIVWTLVMFLKFSIALVSGLCNFENFINITCAHTLAFTRFSMLITYLNNRQFLSRN